MHGRTMLDGLELLSTSRQLLLPDIVTFAQPCREAGCLRVHTRVLNEGHDGGILSQALGRQNEAGHSCLRPE